MFQKPDYMKYKDLDAKSLLRKLEFHKPPYNPLAIARALDIEVISGLDEVEVELYGFIYQENNKRPVIWYNPIDNESMQKFVVAHEIGHFIKHMPIDSEKEFEDTEETIVAYGSGKPSEYMKWEELAREEIEANQFAAELLMPEDDLIEEGKKIMSEAKETNEENMNVPYLVEKLATSFKISERMMLARLAQLKLIS